MMADDTISRQAAIDAIDRYYKDKKYITRSRTTLSAICIDMKNTMDSLPPAQPERKKGKWHQRFYPKVEMMVCSECGDEFSYDAETGVRDYNFCPNCGAYMMEGEQE